jgi:hypothetical protein
LPEIIDHGVTGFLCETLEEMVQSVRHVSVLERSRCRQAFDARFSTERMVKDYLRVYERLVGVSATMPTPAAPSPRENVIEGEPTGIARNGSKLISH